MLVPSNTLHDPLLVARRVTGVIWHGVRAGISKVRKGGGICTDLIFYGRNLSVFFIVSNWVLMGT